MLLVQSARLLYLFSSGIGMGKGTDPDPPSLPPGIYSGPFHALRLLNPSVPSAVSEAVWNILTQRRGVRMTLDDFIRILESAPRISQSSRPVSPWRRKRVVELRFALKNLVLRRWRYLAGGAVLIVVLLYLANDVFKSRTVVPTAGLPASEIVDLYYRGMNELDLDIVDAVFYRGSGKKLMNELSAIYVMSKMGQAFTSRGPGPDDPGGVSDEDNVLFEIRDLSIDPLSGGDAPVFRATYKRVIGSQESVHESLVHETIYLKKYGDRWYIIESTRTLENAGGVPQ